jgi:hypothetical protein
MPNAMIVAAVLLGLVNVANAADATWVGTSSVSKDGSEDGCDGVGADYTIVINNNFMTATPDTKHKSYATMKVDLAALEANGAGTATAMGKNHKPWDFEFEAGTGARKIKYGSRYGTCRFLITPK